MSDISGEQALGTIAGGVAGFFLGGPLGAAKGAYMGYGIGSAFTTTELDAAEGPRLEDRSIQTSGYGEYIPRVYNTDQLTGNLIWLKDNQITETKKVETVEQGGKGGGSEQKVTTFSYSVTCAIGICEGPITGIRRIWADNTLIYDASDTGNATTIAESHKLINNWEVYLGTDDQLPSSTIEDEKGEGNVSAYRGLAYVVLLDFQLEEYGNRIPNLSFEIVDNELNGFDQPLAGLTNIVSVSGYASPYPIQSSSANYRSYPSHYDGGVLNSICTERVFTSSPTTVEGYFMASDIVSGGTLFADRFDMMDFDFATSVLAMNGTKIRPIDNSSDLLLVQMSFSTGHHHLCVAQKYASNRVRFHRINPEINPSADLPYDLRATYRDGIVYLSDRNGDLFINVPGEIHAISVSAINNMAGFSGVGILVFNSTPARDGKGSVQEVAFGVDPYGSSVYTIDRVRNKLTVYNAKLYVVASYDISHLTASPYSTSNGVWSARFAVRNNLVYVTHQRGGGDPSRYLRIWRVTSSGVEQIDEVHVGNRAYCDMMQACIDISFSSVLTSNRPGWINAAVDGGMAVYSLSPLLANSTGLTLPQVIGEEMSRIDVLDSVDYDVTGVTTDTVRGYMVANPSPATSALKPLQQAFRFDVVEEDYKIKFVTRGTVASSVTLGPDDLRAHEQGSQAPPELLQLIKNPNAVPGRIEVSYKDVGIDLETGYAYADRLNLDREAITKMDLPVVLSNDEAAQTSEVLLLDSEREGAGHYQLVTSFIHSHLERAEVITVTTDDEESLLLRIVDIEKGSPGIVKITAVRETITDYNSVAVGDDSSYDTDSLRISVPSFLRFLDIPQLRNGDDNAGMYWGVNPIGSTDNWRGATLFKSNDEGISWSLIDAATNYMINGVAVDSITTDSYTLFTYGQPLTVYFANGVPETKTETQVRNGANMAVYGSAGRWEIIKFITATSIGSGNYVLNGILRGQYGTDWAMDTHEGGDLFIMIDESSANRLSMSDTHYLNDVEYVPVTIGSDFTTGYKVIEASTGEAKKPHSPTHVKGYRDASGNLTITWIPRGRHSFEWSNGQAQTVTDTDVFNIEIMNGATVVRTITSTVAIHAVSYTAAEQVTDFGTAQSSLTVNIHQLGDLITTGHKRETTI